MRKIIHIDMDAFYASVEIRDNPVLKNKPVIVGGSPDHRGVVATCSYEARKYGIHSAMPSKTAYKLCPEAIFVKPRHEVYKAVSYQIGDIFKQYTDLVEFLSLDEAYLDVTNNKKDIPYASTIARIIKKQIQDELSLTASAGVSYNKFLAKIASDYHKPNGLKVIQPEEAQDFLDKLPIQKFFGVGKVTEDQLRKIGVHCGKDLRALELDYLTTLFKKKGYLLYQFARGIDNREVESYRKRKSIGAENTFEEDLDLRGPEAKLEINEIIKTVTNRLKRIEQGAKTITLKVKFNDFTQITRSISVRELIQSEEDINNYVEILLDKVDNQGKKVRLLGITLSNLTTRELSPNISIFEYMREMDL